MNSLKFITGGIFLLLLSSINFEVMSWSEKSCVLCALVLYAFGMLGDYKKQS